MKELGLPEEAGKGVKEFLDALMGLEKKHEGGGEGENQGGHQGGNGGGVEGGGERMEED